MAPTGATPLTLGAAVTGSLPDASRNDSENDGPAEDDFFVFLTDLTLPIVEDLPIYISAIQAA